MQTHETAWQGRQESEWLMELEKMWKIEREIVELAIPLLVDNCKAHIQFHEEKAVEDMTDEEIARIVRYLCPIVMDFAGCVNADDIAKVINEVKGAKE